MDMTWLKDYGALVAATVAALATILNGILAAKRDRSFKTGEWLRQTRMPRYVGFIRAANEFVSAIFWQYAEPDPDITGPEPKVKPEYAAVARDFRHQLAEVILVGPGSVAHAAELVQYGCWHYIRQLERDPFRYNQQIVSDLIADFIVQAQAALDITASANPTPEYREWLRSLPEDS